MNDPTARNLVSQAAIPMALLRRDGAVACVSAPWRDLFGASATLADGLAAPDRDAVSRLLAAGPAGEWSTTDLRLCVDEARWVRLRMTPAAADDEVLAIASDVTASRAALADLQDRVAFMEWQALSFSTFAKVLGSAHLVLFATDRDGVTTMSDGRGLELLGHAPGARVGRRELEATEGTPAHDHLARALRGETLRVLEEPAKGVYFDTWYLPQTDENGAPAGVLGLALDATDRVLSEQRLAEKIEIVARQTATIRDLAAPVIKVWQEVVCLPIIGTVDAPRAADMMERLLESVVRERARFAIIDLTGVEVMDTPTVHHMLRIFAAARAVGIEGVLSGVRPGVAQSVVSLGVDISALRMMRTLHDALAWCLEKREADAGKRAAVARGRAVGGRTVAT